MPQIAEISKINPFFSSQQVIAPKISVFPKTEMKTMSAGFDNFKEGLKSYVNDKTGGVFGNGTMEKKEGETSKEYTNRMLTGLGSALNSFEKSASSAKASEASAIDSLKKGIVTTELKNIVIKALVYGALLGVAYAVIKSFVKRRLNKKYSSNNRRYTRRK